MDAAHQPHFPAIRRLAAPGVPTWLSTWWPRRRSTAATGVRDHVAGTTLEELDPAALRDVGMPPRGMSAREQAARLLQRVGHG
jgi:hypothetical protein